MPARAKAQHPHKLSFSEAYPGLVFLSVSCFGPVWSPCPVIFSLLCCRVAILVQKQSSSYWPALPPHGWP